MNTKSLVAALGGGVTLFAMGFIFYVLLLENFFVTPVDKDPPGFPFIILGELVGGLLLAWVFVRAKVSTPADGAKTGAVLGFLMALGIGFVLYGAYDLAELSYFLADAVVTAVRYGVAGAVVGWLLGRGAAPAPA